VVEPTVEATCPAAQEWHALPLDAWYVPMAQSLHPTDPATANVPFWHAAQAGALYTAL
jgi:hypothetical protein